MREIRSRIHPETKFLSSCELVMSNKLCASKTQWWERCWIEIPISKGGNRKERRSDGSQASPTANNANSMRSYGWKQFPLAQCSTFQAHWGGHGTTTSQKGPAHTTALYPAWTALPWLWVVLSMELLLQPVWPPKTQTMALMISALSSGAFFPFLVKARICSLSSWGPISFPLSSNCQFPAGLAD